VTRREAFSAALARHELGRLTWPEAPWAASSGRGGGASVNLGLTASAPKLRFEDRKVGTASSRIVAAAPTLYNLTAELVYALADAPRDAASEEALGIACDTLAAILYAAEPGGEAAASELRAAVGVAAEPRSAAEGGPKWPEEA